MRNVRREKLVVKTSEEPGGVPGLTDRSLEKRAIKKTVASEGRQAQSVTAGLTEKDCSRKRS